MKFVFHMARAARRHSLPMLIATAAAAILALSTAAHADDESTQAAASAAAAALSPPVCWDFGSMTIGQQFVLGDVVRTPFARIRMVDYKLNGNVVSGGAGRVIVTDTKIAGGTRPELRTYLLNTRVIPKEPIRRVTMQIAENTAGAAPHANIEVNGHKVEVTSGLATMNGAIVGNAAKGRAAVIVNLAPATAGQWNVGTLEMYAVSGAIESYTVSGLQVFKDNECIYR